MAYNRPNILFIIIDSARSDHFSIYNYRKSTTPFIESVSDDFTVYLNANTPACWTRPAMTSIFTGLYPLQYGFFEGDFLGDEMPLLSDILRNQGYQTTLLSNNAFMSPATGFDRGANKFFYLNPNNFRRVLDKSIIVKNSVGIARQFINKRTSFKVISQMINDQASKLIHETDSSSPPFFMYLHHDAHHPYLSDRKYLSLFLDGRFSENEIQEVETIQRSGNMYQFNRDDVPLEKKNKYYSILRAMHDASIYKNDSLIRSLIECMKSKGIYDESLIIIAADHGEFLGERDMISHGLYTYEEVVKVPLLVKYPREFRITGRTDRLVSTIDILPTLLDLLGVDISYQSLPSGGISLISETEHDFVVSEKKVFGEGLDTWERKYPGHSFAEYDCGNLVCFKERNRKYNWSSKGKHKLFDLEKDPGETVDLYSAGDQGEYSGLLTRYETWINEVQKVTGASKTNFDESMKEQLRSLGYF